MTHDRPPEDLLSAYLDNECSEAERAGVEKVLFEDEEMVHLFENMKTLRSFLRSDPSEPPGFRPVDLDEAGFASPAVFPSPSPAMIQMDRETFERLLDDRDRLLAGSRRGILLSAGVSGMVGVVVALLVGGFLFTQVMTRFQPVVTPPVSHAPTPVTVAQEPMTKPPATAPVMVKPPVLEPAPELEALATEASSCIIEIINAADDINTAVFQIPDTDGDLITVVWLTGLELENSI